MHQTFPGILVDVTALIVTLLAAKSGLIPGNVLVAVIFMVMGARATMTRKGPGGGNPPHGGSGAVALLLVAGYGLSSWLSQKTAAGP